MNARGRNSSRSKPSSIAKRSSINYLRMKPIRTYDEPRWKRLREKALKRDKYLDQIEKRYGRYKQAEVVHHIFPVSQFPEYQYELWNLISLTRATHNRMHVRESQELTKEGIDLLIRTAKKNGAEPPQIAPQGKRGNKHPPLYDVPDGTRKDGRG